MKFDRLHTLKGVPPIPAKHDEKAAFILQAIDDLAGLLQGGAGIRCRVAEAHKKAAAHPRKKTRDPVQMGATEETESCATLHRVAANLKLANIAAAEPGKLDESRIIRDLAFIRAAFMRHHEEGVCEIDHPANPMHAPAHVSAADDIQEAGGAYVQAWVWVDLEDVDSGMVEDAANDLK